MYKHNVSCPTKTQLGVKLKILKACLDAIPILLVLHLRLRVRRPLLLAAWTYHPGLPPFWSPPSMMNVACHCIAQAP